MNTFPTLTKHSDLGYPRRVILDSGQAVMQLGNGVLRTRDVMGQAIDAYDDARTAVGTTDKDTFETFYANNRAATFYWTHGVSGTTYTVRFDPASPPQVVPRDDAYNRYDISYRVLPIVPTETPAGTTTSQYYGGDAMIHVENLAAGADISNRPVWTANNPSGSVVITAVQVLTEGAPAGVDDANTVVLTLQDDSGNTIVTRTWNTANQPPSSDAEDLTSLLDSDYTTIAHGSHVTLSVTCGATANMPAFNVQIGGNYA